MTSHALTPFGLAADDQIGRLRLTSRLTAAFLLDSVAIVRGNGHVLDTLLASAIIQANVAEIGRHADLQVTFAESDAIPTDDMRRPVSMNALASSLGLPFETVRRRINGMVRDGFCHFVEGGVIVPSAVLAQPKYFEAALRGYERLRAFYCQLRDLDLLQDLPPPSVDLASGTFPVRTVARLVGAYMLRIVEMLGAASNLVEGNLVDALILLEMFRANVEDLPHEARGEEGFGANDMVPDADRTPVSTGEIARRLGMPPETVRRRVANLIKRGGCVRVEGGLIVPARALANPFLRAAMAGNAANLQRLFGSLSRLGVLKIWDSLPPPAAA